MLTFWNGSYHSGTTMFPCHVQITFVMVATVLEGTYMCLCLGHATQFPPCCWHGFQHMDVLEHLWSWLM